MGAVFWLRLRRWAHRKIARSKTNMLRSSTRIMVHGARKVDRFVEQGQEPLAWLHVVGSGNSILTMDCRGFSRRIDHDESLATSSAEISRDRVR